VHVRGEGRDQEARRTPHCCPRCTCMQSSVVRRVLREPKAMHKIRRNIQWMGIDLSGRRVA
jgi:hypothetical protein